MGQALSRSESREVAFRLIFALGQQTVLDGAAWELALDGKTAPAPEQQYITQLRFILKNGLWTVYDKPIWRLYV